MRLHAYDQADEPVDDATSLKVSAKATGHLQQDGLLSAYA